MTDAIRGSSKKKVYERSTLLECFKSSKLISMKPQWSVSNMQAGGVGTFWTQKNHTRKIGNIYKYLEQYLFMYNFVSKCPIIYILLLPRIDIFWSRGIGTELHRKSQTKNQHYSQSYFELCQLFWIMSILCINFYMENVPKSSFYTLPKLVTAWATTVHVTCVGTIFITFVDTLFVTLIISSHRITELSAVLFKYLLFLKMHVLGFQV